MSTEETMMQKYPHASISVDIRRPITVGSMTVWRDVWEVKQSGRIVGRGFTREAACEMAVENFFPVSVETSKPFHESKTSFYVGLKAV